MKNLYIHKYLILGISIIVVLFLLSYWFEVLFPIAWILVVILLVVVLFDLYILFSIFFTQITHNVTVYVSWRNFVPQSYLPTNIQIFCHNLNGLLIFRHEIYALLAAFACLFKSSQINSFF